MLESLELSPYPQTMHFLTILSLCFIICKMGTLRDLCERQNTSHIIVYLISFLSSFKVLVPFFAHSETLDPFKLFLSMEKQLVKTICA